MAQHDNSDDDKTVERPDAGSGARNIQGQESEQSKERRKNRGNLTDEETVQHIRDKGVNNRMPTKGSEFAHKVKEFFVGKKKKKKGK